MGLRKGATAAPTPTIDAPRRAHARTPWRGLAAMLGPLHILSIGFALHVLAFAVIGIRVIVLRPAPGVGLAWLLVVALVRAAARGARCRVLVDALGGRPCGGPTHPRACALRNAAARGVRVAVIVPERVDSFFVQGASRSYFDDLLKVGVEIHLFRGGLLHTKPVTVDGRSALFRTGNLDMRSTWLNYELSLVVHDPLFVGQLRAPQAT